MAKKKKKFGSIFGKFKLPKSFKALGGLASTAIGFVPGLGPVVNKVTAVAKKAVAKAKQVQSTVNRAIGAGTESVTRASADFSTAREETDAAAGRGTEGNGMKSWMWYVAAAVAALVLLMSKGGRNAGRTFGRKAYGAARSAGSTGRRFFKRRSFARG